MRGREVTKVTALLIKLNRLARDSRGQDLVDYALIAALIASATTASLSSVAVNVDALFAKIAKMMDVMRS